MRLIFVAFAAILFQSCQREVDPSILDEKKTAFTFKSSGNSCADVQISGVYKKGQALTIDDKLTLHVNVTTPGEWTAATNTVNGFGFSGTGSFVNTGAKTITLSGTGNPSAAGATSFTVTAGDNTCGFDINVENSSAPNNNPPTANAGNDQAITLPENKVTLTGSGTDSDGSIVSYQWTKIDGPAGAVIESVNQSATLINNLVQGSYRFELRVTDNAGAIGKDTVRVLVNPATAGGTGTLAFQQDLFFVVGTLLLHNVYDANGRIIAINSDHYPDRRIFYNSKNQISKIEYWYGDPSYQYTRDEVHGFEYNAHGDVSVINYLDTATEQVVAPFQEYTYNADYTLKTRKAYWPKGSTDPDVREYVYTNGNITRYRDEVDSVDITYDNRVNTFKNMSPQYFFLDLQNTFEQTDRGEMFFFSKNYPTKIGDLPVSVTTTTGNKPFEIRFENVLWYRYLYN